MSLQLLSKAVTRPAISLLTAGNLFRLHQKYNFKNQACQRMMRVKLAYFSSIRVNSQMSAAISRLPSLRKILKYALKVSLENSCRRLTHRIRNSMHRSICLSLNPHERLYRNGPNTLAKFVAGISTCSTRKLSLNAIHPSTQQANMEKIFRAVGSNRNLESLKININLNLDVHNLYSFKSNLEKLRHLENLSLSTFNPLGTYSENPNYHLGTTISSLSRLKQLCFRCVVTRSAYEGPLSFFEKLSTSSLEKLDVNLHCSEILPQEFFCKVLQNFSQIKTLKTLNFNIDSSCTQNLDSAVFSEFSDMTHLEKLIFKASKVSSGNQQMINLFSSLSQLKNLKHLHIEMNGKPVNFTQDFYQTFHFFLGNMTQLSILNIRIQNLSSQFFDLAFADLPRFLHLQSLSLNLALSEQDNPKLKYLGDLINQQKRTLRKIDLAINKSENETYTYDVPESVLETLFSSIHKCCNLETLKLHLGSLEDPALTAIQSLICKLERLEYFELDGVFQNISSQTFGDLCSEIKRYSHRIKKIRIHPKHYSHSNFKLLKQLTI